MNTRKIYQPNYDRRTSPAISNICKTRSPGCELTCELKYINMHMMREIPVVVMRRSKRISYFLIIFDDRCFAYEGNEI